MTREKKCEERGEREEEEKHWGQRWEKRGVEKEQQVKLWLLCPCQSNCSVCLSVCVCEPLCSHLSHFTVSCCNAWHLIKHRCHWRQNSRRGRGKDPVAFQHVHSLLFAFSCSFSYAATHRLTNGRKLSCARGLALAFYTVLLLLDGNFYSCIKVCQRVSIKNNMCFEVNLVHKEII